MRMFQKVLYVIWFLFPVFFLLMALWSKLEQVGGKKRQEHPEDFLRQGVFVLCCVLVAVGINEYVLPRVVAAYSPEAVPLQFYQVVLLPLVLLIGAKIMGPTSDLKISKPPDLSRKRR